MKEPIETGVDRFLTELADPEGSEGAPTLAARPMVTGIPSTA
jgi:hypothetical protein